MDEKGGRTIDFRAVLLEALPPGTAATVSSVEHLKERLARRNRRRRRTGGTLGVLAVVVPLLVVALVPFRGSGHEPARGAGTVPVPTGTAYCVLVTTAGGSIERIAFGASPTDATTSRSTPPVLQKALIGGLPGAGAIAVSRATDTAYVASRHGDHDTLTPVDLNDATVGRPIGLGAHAPGPLAISPDGRTAYVLTGGLDDTVLVVDLQRRAVTDSISVGPLPSAIALSPDGSTAYVSSWISARGGSPVPGQVAVIDLATDTVTAHVTVGVGPEGVATSPDGRLVFVSNSVSDTVTAVSTATDAAVATIGVGHVPKAVAVDPSGHEAYVVDSGQNYPGPNAVTPIRTATLSASAPVPVAPYSSQIAMAPDGRTAFVLGGTLGGAVVVPVDLTTDTAGNAVALGPVSVDQVVGLAAAPVP